MTNRNKHVHKNYPGIILELSRRGCVQPASRNHPLLAPETKMTAALKGGISGVTSKYYDLLRFTTI